MTVWMDKHEKGGMRALVEEHCEEVRMSDSFGADYVAGGYAIERKRWDEVAGRMTEPDRDLYYQIDKLVETADSLDVEPAMLLEGEIGSAFSHTRVDAESVALYLAGLPVMGVTVMPSTGRRCSARLIATLERGDPPDVRRVRGAPSTDEEAPRFVIEGFPGVGPGKAEALLDELGSVADVVTAPAERLQEVDGIGPSTAETITDVRDRARD